ILTEFSARGPEQARIAGGVLFGVENALKAQKGKFAALLGPAIMKERAASERKLRDKVAADPQLQAECGNAWDQIAKTLDRARATRDRNASAGDFHSRLLGHALTLVRRAAEKTKPNDQRLREYTDSRFPELRQAITARAPIYPEFEKLGLKFWL